jgi:hypothetical protein
MKHTEQITTAPAPKGDTHQWLRCRGCKGEGREADCTLFCGILSVFLGWTILVPLIGLPYYDRASKLAKE